MNDNIKNIELVKKSYEELQDEVIKLITDKFILKSNWNSLREWLEQQKTTWNIIQEHGGYDYEQILDKMNELEGVDNENN